MRSHHERSPLEWIVAIHVVVYVVGATWAFGGQADWVRGPLTSWGCLGFVIAAAVLLRQSTWRGRGARLATFLIPFIAFNVLVLVASANPSLKEVTFGNETLLAAVGGREWLPSSAVPGAARSALLQFDAIWISCFNIILAVRRRRTVRLILVAAVANATLLAVFGTAQKLLGSQGLFFGAIPSPQPYFFASFVYHNHWGAFSLLMMGALLGLGAHFVRHHQGRDIFHSPAAGVAAAVLIIAASVPFSGSRSSSVLLFVLLLIAAFRWVIALVRKRRQFNESILPAAVLAGIAGMVLIASVWWVGRDVIRQRFELTLNQVAAARAKEITDARAYVYRDTIAMARDKLWFGWGMSSYPQVFSIYNTRTPVLLRFPVYFHDAHSDWLQSVAEHGIVGTVVLASMAFVPLLTIRKARVHAALPLYILLGCGLVVAYAALEFPFGNYAVVLTWWACFVCAVRYFMLSTQETAERDSL